MSIGYASVGARVVRLVIRRWELAIRLIAFSLIAIPLMIWQQLRIFDQTTVLYALVFLLAFGALSSRTVEGALRPSRRQFALALRGLIVLLLLVLAFRNFIMPPVLLYSDATHMGLVAWFFLGVGMEMCVYGLLLPWPRREFIVPLASGYSILKCLAMVSHSLAISSPPYFGSSILWSAKGLLSLLTSQPVLLSGRDLSVGSFRAIIGEPCMGIGAIILFVGLFVTLTMWTVMHARVSAWRTALSLAAGIASLYFLNIVRIVSLMLVGVAFPEISVEMFHQAIGPVLFLLVFLFYIRWVFPWIRLPCAAA